MATTLIPSGFASEDSTGTLSGQTLMAYTGPMTVSAAGSVIENQIIDGSLRVTGANVVIKNCLINFDGQWGIDADGARSIIVQDCTITGPGYSGDSNSGILGSGTFIRNDISKTENGITLTGGASTVKGNFIHDLQDSARDPHYDGISVQGGQNGVLIQDNTILSRDTSDIIVKSDFGSISDIAINHNYLGGDPGYNVYVYGIPNGSTTGVTITNNVIDKGFYGDFSVENSSPVISGNSYYDPSQPTPTPTPNPTPTPTPTPTHEIVGTSGSDKLNGTAGADRIVGGFGNDLLFGGGGADVFAFNSARDSLPQIGHRDLIYDFQHNVDVIDLSRIDAVEGRNGNQSFSFLGEGVLDSSGIAGQIKYHYEVGNNGERTVIDGTTNQSTGIDFQVSLVGHITLSGLDFLL